ncbi:hypothetical protein CB0940_10112 [Cercospora beticola]|nr:hypothetical protein CB0940_10112 [Cercospora beticola]PIA96377.1 hypothetical protein CB0940_10112 [Cercospora beticola]CAK1366728.1 unnamed protein product [Cercospora beticola]
MYESGAWSDITVEAGDPELFKVHKSVIGFASLYFENICNTGYLKSTGNHLKMSESDRIVEAILRHCYGIPAPWTQAASYEASGPNGWADVRELIQLRTAASKYQLRSMIRSIEEAFSAFLQLFVRQDRLSNVMQVGRIVFDQKGPVLKEMRRTVVGVTAEVLWDVLKDDDLFDCLRSHPKYLRRTPLRKKDLTQGGT